MFPFVHYGWFFFFHLYQIWVQVNDNDLLKILKYEGNILFKQENEILNKFVCASRTYFS